MSAVKIAMIAAVARNGVIGARNALPWRLPTDFRFYKATTMGKPLIMGRKTFESIGKPLPGRANIVVSRSGFAAPEGVTVCDSLERALVHARTLAEQVGVDEVFINGGGALYAQALPLAERLYITHVDAEPEGDALFPAFDASAWETTEITGYEPGDADSHRFTIRRYDRPSAPGFD